MNQKLKLKIQSRRKERWKLQVFLFLFLFIGLQDSYALCRVFKKNGICSEVEEQLVGGQSSSLSFMENSNSTSHSQTLVNDYETLSPDILMAASSSCVEEEEKDDSWMQFITEDAWCASNSSAIGLDDLSHLTFTNWNSYCFLIIL